MSNLMRDLARRVPPNFLAMPFGLAGLASVWRTMSENYGVPSAISDVLIVVAATVWASVAMALLARGPRQLAADARDSVLSPFLSLAFIVPIVLAGAGASADESLARIVFIASLIPAALFGGWLTGEWIAGKLEQERAHPGYFLPTVAGGVLSAATASDVGLRPVGMLCFGVGALCWVLLGSVILNRLLFRDRLPAALIPTLAIEVAPPAVAGGAYFAVHGLKADTVSYALAGYAILMVLVQLRLLPLYVRLRFSPGFWAFTFSSCAVAILALRWIELEHPAGQRPLAWLVCGSVSALVAAIAARSALAGIRRELLPPEPQPGSVGATPGHPATGAGPVRAGAILARAEHNL
jgi:tellurite resistance protein